MKISKQTKNFVLIVLSALLALTLALGLFTAAQKPAYAEATLYDVTTPNATPFQSGWNNNTSGGNKYTVLYFTGVPMDKGVDVTYGTADGFNNGITLNYGGQTLTGAETGITYGGTLGGMNGYFYFKSSTSASYLSATGSNYATLTIPANTVVHNLTFKNELKYYFYSGAWSLEQPAVVETRPVNGVSIEKAWNNKVHNSETVLVTYLWKSGVTGYVTPDTAANTDTLATFNANIKLEYDGQTLTGTEAGITAKADKFASFKPGIVFGYSASAAFTAATAENPAKLTIPTGSVLFDAEFITDIVIYFYDGTWTLNAPPVSVTDYSIEQARNNVAQAAITSGNHVLFIYANGTPKLNSSYAEGNIDSNIELNGQKSTEVFTAKVYNGDPTIHLEYSANASFINATASDPAVLTIPKGTTYYNLKFDEDINIYFYNGKWYKKPSIDYYLANLLTMSAGAEVRMDVEGGRNGIRFTTNVNADSKAALDGLVSKGTIKGYTFGTIIVPFDYLTEIDNPTHETLKATYGYYDIASTYQTGDCFKGALVNLKTSNYDRKWIGRGYVAITNADDTVTYVYANFDGAIADNARSIVEVATETYNKRVELELDDEQIAILVKYGVSVEE